MEGAEDLPVAAGDIVVFPHGDPHTMSNGVAVDPARTPRVARQAPGPATCSMAQYGGGGAATRFVCGYFGCERHADRLFLAGLPPMIKINVRGDAAGEWLESSIRHLVSEAAVPDAPDTTVLLSKMAEALFIETMRRYVEQLPPEQTGWLAGARDAGGRRRPCASAPEALPSLDRWRSWPLRPGPRARSWRSGSPGFSASRR